MALLGPRQGRSPLGAFIRSPLGVLTNERVSLHFTMVFIDESTPYGYGNNDSWSTDLREWNRLIAVNGAPREGVVLCDLPSRLGYNVAPSQPQGVSIYKPFPRDPFSADPFIDAVNFAYIGNGDYPSKIVMLIDQSGSMTRRDLEPGIDSFNDWASENDSENDIEIEEHFYSDERWLRMLVQFAYTETVE
jgi:hypothetical protein